MLRRRDLPMPLTVSPEAAEAAQQADNKLHRWPMTPRITKGLRAKGAGERRAAVESLARSRRVDITASQVSVSSGGRPVTSLVMTPETPSWDGDGDEPWVFWIHGGGFCWGSALDGSAVQLAADAGVPVVSVEYPLAPEHPYPAPLDACLAAYLAHAAAWGPRVLLGGLSAGANLALGVLARVRADGGPEPLGLLAATPFADLGGRGDSYSANEGRDAYVRWKGQQERFAKAYRGGARVTDPFVSPVHQTWEVPVPPTLLTTGTRDLFLSDSVQLARTMRASGGEVDLQVWEGMWHAFQNDASSPEAQECLAHTATFARQVLRVCGTTGRSHADLAGP